MAAPTVRETLSTVKLYTDASDTCEVTTGAGTQVGDWLVAYHGIDYGDSNQGTGAGPGVWEHRTTASYNQGPSHIRVFIRRVTVAGAQTVSVAHTDINADGLLVVLVISGARATDMVDVGGMLIWGSHATVHDAPSIDPTDTDSLLACAWMTGPDNGEYGNYAAPAGMTERAEVDAPTYSTLMVATKALTVGTATGVQAATFTRNASPTTATKFVSLSLAFRAVVPEASHSLVSPLAVTMSYAVSKEGTATYHMPVSVT